MKRLLYKLAFWFLTLSWVGGNGGCDEDRNQPCDDDKDCEEDGMICMNGDCMIMGYYGPRCYRYGCEDGYVCWESVGECILTCETDEDCATATMGASDEYGPDYCATIICNKYEGVCWEGCETCFEDKHCEDWQTCVHHRCEPVEPVADGDEDDDSELDEDGDTELEAAEDTEDETDDTPSR